MTQPTALTALASRHCRPLKGADHLLETETVRQHLALLADWELVEDGAAIQKTFRFSDYYRTMAFVNALAHVAHAQDHHPDLGVHYDRAVVRFSTHDVGGLSENDFICAAKAQLLG
jgi:4a-hydroxytetrahydrobiopterin dehydratase